jgi:mono/diheme cytochrome c family protein
MMETSLRRLLDRILPRWSPLMFKATLISMVVAALVIPVALAAVPFIEFFNGMAAQPKAKTQMTYGRVHGEELLVERSPVPGTIPREYEWPLFAPRVSSAEDATPGDTGPTIEDAQEIGGPVVNPVPITREALQRGQEQYEIYCIACHGRRGEGDGLVVGAEKFPAPPSLHTDQARNYTDGTIYYVITTGVGTMPGYARQLDPSERWETIHYLRALQRSMSPQPEDLDR